MGRRLVLGSAICGILALSAATAVRAEEGGFRAPASGETLAPGAVVAVRWASRCAEAADAGALAVDRVRPDESELVLSLDGGLTFPVRVSSALPPCAAGFEWRVPALPSSRARLAFRVGDDEDDERETIALVGDEFTILPDPDGDSEALVARKAEWWTPQSPLLTTAEDLATEGMRSEGGRLVAVPGTFAGVLPPSAPAVGAPRSAAPASTPSSAGAPSRTCRIRAIRPASPTPLRL